MQRIAFWQLPLWVRIAVPLTVFNTWVWIAEFVIDRYGFDEHLPFYRYGDVCIYEVVLIIALVVAFVRASRVPRTLGRSALPPDPNGSR